MVSASRLDFPLDLGARGSCDLGGNVATKAGGSHQLCSSRKRDPYNRAFLNPADPAARELVDGERIAIHSEHAQIMAIVKDDPSVRPGVVTMAHQPPHQHRPSHRSYQRHAAHVSWQIARPIDVLRSDDWSYFFGPACLAAKAPIASDCAWARSSRTARVAISLLFRRRLVFLKCGITYSPNK